MSTPTEPAATLPENDGGPILAITEAELAEKLGVDRATLVEIRTVLLLVEKDWARKKNAVVYYRSGVEGVCAQLEIALPEGLLAEPEKKDGAGGEVRTVYVRRPARLNRKMIFCTEKKDGAEETELPVRVRNAAMFVPGQEIRITVAAGLATLFGPQPRQRGKTRRHA